MNICCCLGAIGTPTLPSLNMTYRAIAFVYCIPCCNVRSAEPLFKNGYRVERSFCTNLTFMCFS